MPEGLVGARLRRWTRPVPESDEAVLRRVGRGDPDALTELYRRHSDGLFGFLLRLSGDRMIAARAALARLLAEEEEPR